MKFKDKLRSASVGDNALVKSGELTILEEVIKVSDAFIFTGRGRYSKLYGSFVDVGSSILQVPRIVDIRKGKI